ncbi:hypothetical protein BLA23254_01516 [Burkholderia lata]|uniref:Uncharacterized protein n=1 Tax=Burkholderia lata (strain ATCC 17760 / DSM 23089 / LMG 22485 / NCIMB 9086 / R18194 / 383) TaxID=482957 RepID=A0A6P2IV08_BURL3|nr:hypothetical protein [Burkholderia lata]VWB34716.1 hypothetical protein BLA23254_01516 [Burkholderia lata]
MDFRDISTVDELRDFLGSTTLIGIDSEYSPTMSILKKQFGAKGIHVNRWWVMTSPDWLCPACGRTKPKIVRLDQHHFLMGQLHEHHDHMRDLVRKTFLAEAVKRQVVVADDLAEKFAIRTAFGLSAYDNTVICSDCNYADAHAKRMAGTHQDFSFSPAEIRQFVEPRPNVGPHLINATIARKIWEEGRAIFAMRMAMVNRVAKMAASNFHWYQASEVTAARTEKRAKDIFSWTGLAELARRLGANGAPETLLYSTSVRRGNSASWRHKKTKRANKVPSEQDIQLLEGTRGKFWSRVGPDWHCECCERSRFQCVRPSGQSPWVFEVKEKVLYDPTVQRRCTVYDLCEDCSNVARHLAREALDTAEADLRDPSSIVSLAELSAVICPQPHSHHDVDNEKIDDLLHQLIDRISEFSES